MLKDKLVLQQLVHFGEATDEDEEDEEDEINGEDEEDVILRS